MGVPGEENSDRNYVILGGKIIVAPTPIMKN